MQEARIPTLLAPSHVAYDIQSTTGVTIDSDCGALLATSSYPGRHSLYDSHHIGAQKATLELDPSSKQSL